MLTSQKKVLKNILLIDDDHIYRKLFGYSVESIDSTISITDMPSCDKGIEYLSELNNKSQPFPDMILVDVNMPMKDGYDFARIYTEKFGNMDKEVIIYINTSSISNRDQEKTAQYPILHGLKIKDDVIGMINEIIKDHF